MRIFPVISLILLTSVAIAQRLVLPGDYPDPSVVKIGDTYWASATTSNWAPLFPLLASKDLVHWETKGHIFKQLPAWADYYFWAPEITYDNGKVYVYYSAHKRGGNLCVGVARADRPEGPYEDLGPIMCEEDGSIDAFPVRDTDGTLYLVWKEDGNSVRKPTPIWAMPLKPDRTGLTGKKIELFHNDAPWENNLVEGVAMIRHNEYLYAFYAGAGCCGNGCTYATGVARAKSLLGPWEKYAGNPILTSNDHWKCPGHGTPTMLNGRYYLLHHAYTNAGSAVTGRQGVLTEFTFTDDGWIKFLPDQQSGTHTPQTISDTFDSKTLDIEWQWSVFQKPEYALKNGDLLLKAIPQKSGAILARMIYTPDYEATAQLSTSRTTAEAGIALIGDEQNFISTTLEKGRLIIRKVSNDAETIVQETTVPKTSNITLRVTIRSAKDATFAYSADGKRYTAINTFPIDIAFIPPWDRAIRIGLISKGTTEQRACFTRFMETTSLAVKHK